MAVSNRSRSVFLSCELESQAAANTMHTPTHLVLWQHDVVEARVGRWEPSAARAIARNGKRRGQVGQPLDGHTVTPSNKKEQFLLLLHWHFVRHLPKPRHCLVAAVVPPMILGPRLQLEEIQALAAAHQELQLFGPEERERRAFTHFQKTALEGGKLAVDGALQEVLGVELDVLLAVGVGHWYVAPIFNEVNLRVGSDLFTTCGTTGHMRRCTC